MKKYFFLIGLFLTTTNIYAQRTGFGMTNAEQLGTTAGVALACNAGNRLDDFELISGYIIAAENFGESARQKAFKEYASAKLKAYNMQKDIVQTPCDEILNTFYTLPIFASIVYKDGTVKLPDGKILKNDNKNPKQKVSPTRNYMAPLTGG